jgi:hypothetical protein
MKKSKNKRNYVIATMTGSIANVELQLENLRSYGRAGWYCVVRQPVKKLKEVNGRYEPPPIVKTALGELPVEDLRRSVDVDSFVEHVWERLKCYGDMYVNLTLPDGLVVEIEATKSRSEELIHSVMFDSERTPDGLCGRWVV